MVWWDELEARLAVDDGHDFHQAGDGGVGVQRTFTSFGVPHNPYRHDVPTEPWREEWRTAASSALLGVGPGDTPELYRTTTSTAMQLRCEGGVVLDLS